MRSIIRLLFILALANFGLVSPILGQSSKDINHLLWRISGRGLSTPSYLYGTIHLSDKRVFNFGDSLYSAFEKSDGYAMELNPDSLLIDYFENKDDEDSSILVKDAVNKKLYEKAKKKLAEKLGKPADKITVKDLRSYHNSWMYKMSPGTSMQSFMDAYLYNAAKKAGKWVGGIEDVADQKFDRETTPAEFYVDEILNDNRQSKQMMEEMIRIYQAENLEKLDMISNFTSKFRRDTILIRRNLKMARRIDSLSTLRNTLFAVGAAHLPGDSGLISLLRKKGFTIEPVISSKRIPASSYKFPEKEVQWVTVTSQSDLYSAQFPGDPQSNNLFDVENLEMKVYADIGTNLFYFTMAFMSGQVKNEDSLYGQMLKNFAKKSEVISKKEVQHQGVKGKELIAKGEDIMYRLRIFIKAPSAYVAMVGSQAEDPLYSKDADKFFSSFKMNTEKKLVIDKTWNKFEDERKAFSIEFPGKPSIKRNFREDEDGFITDKYTYLDLNSIIFFSVVIKDADKDTYINEDSTAFSNYVKTVQEDGTIKVQRSKQIKFNGYPALTADLINHEDGENGYSRVLYLHRGNRMYLVISAVQDTIKTRAQVDRFFSSFQLLPLKEKKWSQVTDPHKSFTTWAPGPMVFLPDSTEPDESQYASYDSLAPATLFVQKIPYSPHFWAKDDTSLLRKEANARVRYTDSLLDYKLINIGNYKGAEALLKISDNSNLKKFRFLLVGDTLYIIYSIAMKEVHDTKNYHRFFEDFRLVNEKAVSTLFQKKTGAYLSALAKADSAALEDLKPVLDEVSFGEEDLPLLHPALLRKYADSGEYSSVSDKLFDIVGELNSKSTAEFVKKTYPELPAEKEHLRYSLLSLLAKQKNAESYQLIVDLIKARQPRGDNPYELFYELSDSLLLTKSIYPDLLPLLRDSSAWRPVVSLTNSLLDSNLIDKSILNGYMKEINQIAQEGIKTISKKDFDYPYWYFSFIELLGKLKTRESELWLRKFLASTDIYLKYYAASALLENNLPVGSADLLKIAADKDYRITLYERLKKLKKESLFPATYKNQKTFAESDLYVVASESYEVDVQKISFITEKTATYQGKKHKFYLFKVTIDWEDGPEHRLGIAGPYSLKAAPLVTESELCGLFMDEEFNAAKLDSLLRAYLLQREKGE